MSYRNISMQLFDMFTLRKKCPYSDLFWFVFYRIRTEYGEILPISPYLVQKREYKDHNNSEYGHILRSVNISDNCIEMLRYDIFLMF